MTSTYSPPFDDGNKRSNSPLYGTNMGQNGYMYNQSGVNSQSGINTELGNRINALSSAGAK